MLIFKKKIMVMMLSEFIKRLESQSDSAKVKSLVAGLKAALDSKGDIEVDIDALCAKFGIEI
jgi:hypothetical protein